MTTNLETNCPPLDYYLNPNRNLTFSYDKDNDSFQQGLLGVDAESNLIGNLHLNYQKCKKIKRVSLHLKGLEKTLWIKSDSIKPCEGERVLIDEIYVISESVADDSIENLKVPFKILLPDDLPGTIETRFGSVYYNLRAIVNRKNGLFNSKDDIVEIKCPLKTAITLNYTNISPHKIVGSKNELIYAFHLPPQKCFQLGTTVSIPMSIYLLESDITIRKVEISLKNCMSFQCDQHENLDKEEQVISHILQGKVIKNLKPISEYCEKEFLHTIEFSTPNNAIPTYSGELIKISNKLCIRFCFCETARDFQIEESVQIGNIYERFTHDHYKYFPNQFIPEQELDNNEHENEISREIEVNGDLNPNLHDFDTGVLTSKQQETIRQLRLNHGLFLDGSSITHSKMAVIVEDGSLNANLYKGHPIVYTSINDPESSTNLLAFYDNDKANFKNPNLPNECIVYPVAEVTYKGDLIETFSNYVDDSKEQLHDLYGHLFAKKTLLGGKLFITYSTLVTKEDIEFLKYHLFWAYDNAKYQKNNENPFGKISDLNFLPRVETSNGEKLNTLDKLVGWMNRLYREEKVEIISYNDLIPISQLRNKTNSGIASNEKIPGVINYKEKLSFTHWIGDSDYFNLTRFVKDFHLLHGLVMNKREIKIGKKIAINLVKIPEVSSNNRSYFEIIKPSTKLEELLISNNFSIKETSTFPFIKMGDFDDLCFGDNLHLMVKCERYEILINKDHIKPLEEFITAIDKALDDMKPNKALQDIFNEYGHLFPQKIVLGRSLKNILSISPTPFNNEKKILTPPILKNLRPILDDLNISYLLTQKGKFIDVNDSLLDWIQNINNNNLEIIEYSNIISLYDILELKQKRKIDMILENNDQNNFKIIMTGIDTLQDLDINNLEHFKRVNLKNLDQPLEGSNYEVFGSIVTKDNLKTEDFSVIFSLYDVNGFSAMITTLEKTTILDITECYILWMIIGNPSSLSIFSPKNREFQVNCKKESITLRHDNSCLRIQSPCQLSKGYVIFVNANYKLTNYKPKNIIKLVGWSYNCIEFQIVESVYNESKLNVSDPSIIISDSEFDEQSLLDKDVPMNNNNITIDLCICIINSDYKGLKIDHEEKEYSLDLLAYILSEKNFDEKLSKAADENNIQNIIIRPFIDDIQMIVSIDIGTIYSRFAIASKKNNYDMINENSFDTNTVLLYDENYNEIKEWGSNAMAERPTKKVKKHNICSIIEHFKLHLLEISEENKPPLPKDFDYKKAIVDYLRQIKNFLVVNCGGGMVELTLRQLSNNQLAEKSSTSSKHCGSICVNKEFLAFVAKKVGLDALKSLQNNHYEQLQYMVQQFCKNCKLKFTGNSGDYIDYQMDLEESCPAIKDYITEPYKEVLMKKNWVITLEYEDVKKMFEPIINQIIKLIREQIYSINTCFAMILVGGFSQSQYLQTCIKKEFDQTIKHISVPRHPFATIKGALEYGSNTKLIHSRVITMTYGISTYPGKEEQRKRFLRLVQKGTEVHVNQEFEYEIRPCYKNQTTFSVELYTTTAPNAIYCDEPDMKKIGNIDKVLPKSWSNQFINLVLFFGQIEIHPYVRNRQGEILPANLNLLDL
ncbi:5855_t:CDS:2 [Funneliformis geosporum]|nr:5855_t:CDS:2 [Funneliformis geosporum]